MKNLQNGILTNEETLVLEEESHYLVRKVSLHRFFEKKVDRKPCRGGQEEEGLRSTFFQKVDGGPVIKGRVGGVSTRDTGGKSPISQPKYPFLVIFGDTNKHLHPALR